MDTGAPAQFVDEDAGYVAWVAGPAKPAQIGWTFTAFGPLSLGSAS